MGSLVNRIMTTDVATTNHRIIAVLFSLAVLGTIQYLHSDGEQYEHQEERAERSGAYSSIYQDRNWLIHVPNEYNELACLYGSWNNTRNVPYSMDQPNRESRMKHKMPMINVYIKEGFIDSDEVCYRTSAKKDLCITQHIKATHEIRRGCSHHAIFDKNSEQYSCNAEQPCVAGHMPMSNFYGPSRIQMRLHEHQRKKVRFVVIMVLLVVVFMTIMFFTRNDTEVTYFQYWGNCLVSCWEKNIRA